MRHGPNLPVLEWGKRLRCSNTTFAFLMRRSDLFPGGWERMDERCIDRGDTGALGGIAAGGKGADAPVVQVGAGFAQERVAASAGLFFFWVPFWAAWGGGGRGRGGGRARPPPAARGGRKTGGGRGPAPGQRGGGPR